MKYHSLHVTSQQSINHGDNTYYKQVTHEKNSNFLKLSLNFFTQSQTWKHETNKTDLVYIGKLTIEQ